MGVNTEPTRAERGRASYRTKLRRPFASGSTLTCTIRSHFEMRRTDEDSRTASRKGTLPSVATRHE